MTASTDEGFYATPDDHLPAGSQGRPCPACGRVNDRRRVLCRHCGVDLATGRELPHLTPRDAGSVPPPEPVVRPRRRWWLPLVAVAFAALVALGALALAGVGPFGSSQEIDLPPASFDPSRYPDEPRVLPLSDIATLTTRPPAAGRSFDALNMVDDTATTMWLSNDADRPEGLPETIEVVPESAFWLAGVVLRNGDQSDALAYEASSRLREVLVIADGGIVLRLTLLDEGITPQQVDLEQPVLTTAVRIEVVDRYLGDGPDVAVSDLDLLGWVADPEDVDVAARRAELLPAADVER